MISEVKRWMMMRDGFTKLLKPRGKIEVVQDPSVGDPAIKRRKLLIKSGYQV